MNCSHKLCLLGQYNGIVMVLVCYVKHVKFVINNVGKKWLTPLWQVKKALIPPWIGEKNLTPPATLVMRNRSQMFILHPP